MNRDQLTALSIGIACFFAFGTAATTLSSTLDSDHDDAIDLDYQQLPVESADIATLQDDIETEKRDIEDPPEVTERELDERELDGDPPERLDTDAPGVENGTSPGLNASQDGPYEATVADDSEAESDSASPWWVGLGSLLVVIAVVLVRSRFRPSRRSAQERSPDRQSVDGWEPDPPPENNVVFAAWVAMMNQVDDGNTAHRTTEECARAATAAGMDPDAVETLTRTFEEVRYGGRPVTSRRRQRVAQVCQRLPLDVEGKL